MPSITKIKGYFVRLQFDTTTTDSTNDPDRAVRIKWRFRIASVIAVGLAISVGGCSDTVSQPAKEIPAKIEQTPDSLAASASQLSDTDSFFLRYSVALDGLHDHPTEGTYEYQNRSRQVHQLQAKQWPRVTYSSTLANCEYTNHGYRVSLQVELVSFDKTAAAFSVTGHYEFRRPRTDADEPGRVPFVWEAKEDFLPTSISLEWGETEKIVFDISQVERFDLFRDFVGNEITLVIANPEWSSMPWENDFSGE